VAWLDNPKLALRVLVHRDAKSRQNHFCLIAYRLPDDALMVWVHWLEGQAVILWEPMPDRANDLVWSRRYLRFDHDVVASEEELKGSTYLVTKTWVQGLVEDCGSNGDHLVIEKNAGL
jgi:hypothetical protein